MTAASVLTFCLRERYAWNAICAGGFVYRPPRLAVLAYRPVSSAYRLGVHNGAAVYARSNVRPAPPIASRLRREPVRRAVRLEHVSRQIVGDDEEDVRRAACHAAGGVMVLFDLANARRSRN